MTNKRAIEIIENEKQCVIRQSGPGIVCDRNCASCELVLPDQDVLDAYDKAIAALENLEDCRNELCLKCGQFVKRHLGVCDGCRWRGGNDKA